MDKQTQTLCQVIHTFPRCHHHIKHRPVLRMLCHKIRKQLLHDLHQISRPNGLALPVYLGIRYIKIAGRLRHIQVQIQSLNKHLLPGRGRQLHIRLSQKLPVHVGNNAALRRTLWNIAIIYPQEKQCLYLLKSGSLHIADHHTVHILGNGAHLNLPKSGLQNVCKLLQRNGLRSQKLINLIQQIHHQPINLGILPGSGQLPLLREHFFQAHQLLLHLIGHQKII